MNNHEITVSILMTAYNHERFIAQALDSILMQETEYHYQIIVGEDCSTDQTRAILSAYVKKYPTKILPLYREKNLGMFKNVLDTLSHCTGQYLAFLEGDDVWTDVHKLQRQVSFLEAHPDYVAVSHECNMINQKGDILEPHLNLHGSAKNDFTTRNVQDYELPGQTATLLIRFDSCMLHSIIPKLRFCFTPLDRILPVILLSHGKIHIFPEIMSSYRFYIEENGTNWSSSHDINYTHNYFLRYLYVCQIEFYARKFHLNLDMMHQKGYTFYLSYKCAKDEGIRKCYLHCILMFLCEFHKITYFYEIIGRPRR